MMWSRRGWKLSGWPGSSFNLEFVSVADGVVKDLFVNVTIGGLRQLYGAGHSRRQTTEKLSAQMLDKLLAGSLLMGRL